MSGIRDLTTLGYGEAQASSAIASAMKTAPEGATTAQLLKLGLREMAT